MKKILEQAYTLNTRSLKILVQSIKSIEIEVNEDNLQSL